MLVIIIIIIYYYHYYYYFYYCLSSWVQNNMLASGWCLLDASAIQDMWELENGMRVKCNPVSFTSHSLMVTSVQV